MKGMVVMINIGVYLKNPPNPEPVFKTITPQELIEGKNISEVLRRLGISKKNFARAVFQDEFLFLKTEDYAEFTNTLWIIREKLIKKEKK